MEHESNPIKLLITYDPVPECREAYLQYVRGEFVPKLEQLGLRMCDAWHTAYGPHPLRLAAFLAEDAQTMESVVDSDIFLDLEDRLQDYVVNYKRRIVPLRSGFQY
jgi:hypothetical protein